MRLLLLTAAIVILYSSCAPKYGCPGNRNMGAENAENVKHPPKYSSSLNKFGY